jgi:tetratricopeptide (TPR) repeat protein
MFWLGENHWNEGNYADAEAQFATLAARDPAGDQADQALFWAARSAARMSEYLRASDHLTELARLHPESPRMPEARLLQGDVLSELGKFSGAILAFEEIIKNWPNSYLVDRAWGRKGDCQFTLGTEGTNGVPQQQRFEEALASYQTVYDSPAAQPKLKLQALYKMGRCQEKMGNSDEAIERYKKVVYEYFAEWGAGTPLDPVWFTRAAFSAGGLMESNDDWYGATRMYRRVVDAGVPSAEEARKRIQRIRLENWFLF